MTAALVSPRMVLLHVFALVALVGTGWLGAWQVGAWQENREDKALALRDAAALPLDDVLGADDPFPGDSTGQPVSVSGEWLGDETVYVEHGSSSWVVTPVGTASGSAMLVVRGSTEDEEAPPVTGDVTLEGWLQPSSESGVRVVDVLQDMDRDLYSGYVITRTPVEQALSPVSPDQLPKPDTFTSLRNLLYGLEWWVFGGFVLFLWWRWSRDEIERVRSVSDRTDADEDAENPEVASNA